MPQVIITQQAVRNLERLRDFLGDKNPDSAKRSGEKILRTIKLLARDPQIGRPMEDMPAHFRELIIDFGDSGYVALYHYANDRVTILAIRHQKEAGY